MKFSRFLSAGPDFKYEYSYEKIAELIQKFVPAAMLEMEKFFSLVVFNYLMSNGDAHLKNFAVFETRQRDYIVRPAHDEMRQAYMSSYENRLKALNYSMSGKI